MRYKMGYAESYRALHYSPASHSLQYPSWSGLQKVQVLAHWAQLGYWKEQPYWLHRIRYLAVPEPLAGSHHECYPKAADQMRLAA
jgi:hypothetical protein